MKSAFITGANRGLGYGFAEYLASKGFLVFAGTRKITDTLPQRECKWGQPPFTTKKGG